MGRLTLRPLIAAAFAFWRFSVMSLFNKAKSKKVEEPKKKAKGVAWLAGDPSGDSVAKSIKELVKLDAERKALEARMDIHKTVVKKYAHDNFVSDFAGSGILPDTPMYVQTSDGEKVTYVVQDRSTQYKVSDEQKEALSQLVGPDAVDSLLYEECVFKFNREVMAIPGVQEVVDEALTEAVRKLTGGVEPVLTDEQGDILIEADKKVSFKPGTLDRVPQIVGCDTGRIRQFIDIMASCCTRYIRP
jgi:hypothetical protein